MPAKANLPKIEADAIFHAVMTCIPAVTQAYRYFRAQGKTEADFDHCAREAMTKAVRNAVELTAREVADPVWPYALDDADGVATDQPAGWHVSFDGGLTWEYHADDPWGRLGERVAIVRPLIYGDGADWRTAGVATDQPNRQEKP